MANGIDRLERLFSKKKFSAASREQQQAADYNAPPSTSYSSRFALRKGSAAVASPASPTRHTPLDDMRFPQPSFIRPKAARMIPRDDHAHGPVSPSRPGTANRSMSVPEGPPTLPQLAASIVISTSSSTATTTTTKVVPPPRSAGGLTARSPHGPPVAYTTQARSMSVTSPHRRTFDSRRSSGSINYNYNNYCSTSATLSSSGSSTMSSSTHTSNGSSNHPNRRSSYIETPCELSDAAARAVAVPTNNGRVLASVNVQRLPKRSSSLLQRRDVFVSPLANLDTYQISNTGRRDSVAITISSGEISPSTVHPTPVIPNSPKVIQQEQAQQPELKIQGDELHELRELQGLSDLPHTPPLKDLQQPLFFSQQTDDEAIEHPTEETAAPSSPKSELPIFTETPLLRRDSVFAPIVLPQSRSSSPSVVSAVSARRRSRRRPMSLRYQRHLPIEPKPSSPSSVLMEPNLGDFLSLSDDDIAEDAAAAAASASAVTASTASPAEATKVVEEKKEEAKEESVPETNSPTPRASIVPAVTTTPAEDVPPTTPPKTPAQIKNALALQKPLPPAPVDSTPPTTTSPPVSPTSLARRRALVVAAPPSLPPAFQAPPPAFLSLLPGMPLLPSPMSVTPSTVTPSARPRTPAGEARMAAAFEIARIASQYKFDLAYIATIWPKNMAFPASASASTSASTSTAPAQSIGWPSSPTSPSAKGVGMSRNNSQTSSRPPLSGRGANRASHVSHASHSSQNSLHSQSSNSSLKAAAASSGKGVFSPVGMRQSKLEAQFLAAYGLATVRAPYSLSAPTHAKILNAERWLEFSEPDAQPDEFSRGYGCAFYRGRAPVQAASTPAAAPTLVTQSQQARYQRRPSTDDCDADTEQDARAPRPRRKASTSSSASNNRGIVFVAYRRKEVADERARRQEKDDLEALYRDVEALVGKILGVHLQQQRQAQQPGAATTTANVEDVLAAAAAGGFPGAGAACTLRQSRFLGVKAA